MKLHLGITQKLTLAFVLFAAVLLGGLGIPANNNGRAALQEAIQSELLQKALDQQAALENWVGDGLAHVTAMAGTPSLVEIMETLVAAPAGTAQAQAAHDRLVGDLLPQVNSNHAFLGLFVLEPEQAQVIAATDPTEEGKYRETLPYFINGKNGPYVQNVYHSVALQAPAMTVAAPLIARDGRLLGVLVGRLNLADLNAIMQQRTGLRKTDEAFLVNASNQFVTTPRLSPDFTVLRSGIHTEAVGRCLTHEEGVISALDYRGVPAIISYRWLPERDVCLIVKLDRMEAFASITALGRSMSIMGLLVMGLASFLAYGLARGLTGGLHLLTQGAAQIGQGNLDYQIELKSQDELGQLARSFNEMTANLRRNQDRLVSANKELEAFSYSVSHDLRAPLRAIDGFSRILMEDFAADLPAEAARFLDLVRSNSQKMGQLVDDLLAFSRLGRQPLNKRQIAPADLVHQVLADLKADLEDRKIEIIVGDLPDCDGDPALLKQVFINLLANAIKFTRGREMATIEIGWLSPQAYAAESGHPSPGEALAGTGTGTGAGDETGNIYFVRDNGVGFDMRYVDKLFGVFQRLHRAEDYAGTGVGLAIVQRIIVRHGGRVWAEAAVDQGATFYFSL